MKFWKSYAQALLDVAPSRILGSLIGESALPQKWRHLSSYPVDGKPNIERFILKHPISAKEMELKTLNAFWFSAGEEERRRFIEVLRLAEEAVARRLENAGSIEKFAKLWNRLPESLREEYERELEKNGLNPAIAEELVHFPANPSIPDHDWLSRLDVYASLRAGEVKLIRFKLSPIQGFIANARTERDLWAGSHILSLLTYIAISEMWHLYGPHSVIFPHLRGQPFFEHELGEPVDDQSLKIGNMPNKVLAMVPADADVHTLERTVRERITSFLEALFKAAWEFYGMDGYFEMDERYIKTIRGYFSITVEEIPLRRLDPEKGEVVLDNLREYLKAIPDDEESEIHSYSELFLLLDQLTDFKSRDHIRPEQEKGFKCTLCGEHLAIGGSADFKTVRKKWKKFVESLHGRGIYDIKTGERLCPLCLVKRFYRRFYPLWVERYSRTSDATMGELIREHFEGKYLDRMAFASVSEVAIRRPTEKAMELFRNGELFVDEGDHARPVTWADVYGWILHNLEIETSNPPRFKGSRVADLTSMLFALSSALFPLFKRLAPNSEVFYVENLRDIRTLAKIYGTDENDRRLKGVNLDSIRRILEGSENWKKLDGFYKLLGEPPKYYAILKMDGDNMGKVISGARGVKSLGEYALGDAPDVSRPVTPPIHIAITRSLSRFAVKKVPTESQNENAELLYAGGDDVFALVPTERAIELAYTLQGHFRTDWDGFEPLQGNTRSMSAGILIVYYKEPLYSAVRRVNDLEHLAKESGRNALAIGYLKHSGSYYRVAVNWRLLEGFNTKNSKNGKETSEISPLLSLLNDLRQDEAGLSNRIIHEIGDGVETWPNSPKAVINLLKYEVMRHSNYGEGEKEQKVSERIAEFLWVARHVRVRISREELEELGFNLGEETIEKINEMIASVLVDDPEEGEPDERFEGLKMELQDYMKESGNGQRLWFRKIEEGLSEVEGIESRAGEIAGLVLRKQLRGAAYLLKILLEMGVGA